MQRRLEEFEARESLEKLESVISNSSPPTQPTPSKHDQETLTPKYDLETQTNIDNYLQMMSKYQQFETQIRQLKVKKANYQHSLDRAIVLNPDEDVDMNESKLARSILDINKKIQRLEKKQKSIGESLKVIQSEVSVWNG